MHYDVLVVGGGLTGGSLACALAGARADLSVALIDSGPREGGGRTGGLDERAIALAEGSMRILTSLGLGAEVRRHAAPIERVHVSDRGRFGFTRLAAKELGLPALGYVTDARTLSDVLDTALAAATGLKRYVAGRILGVEHHADSVTVVLNDAQDESPERLSASLLVAADGGHSPLRSLLGVETVEHDYGQAALTANLRTSRAPEGTAFERFTESGPIAVLPRAGGVALIWTLPSERASLLAESAPHTVLEMLQASFGNRLGKFTSTGRRTVHPLKLIRALDPIGERVVMVGNAAHTLHPVAGQGLNLSLRDVAALAEVVVDARRADLDPGAGDTLERYRRWREGEQRAVTWFTDGLVKLFSVGSSPIGLARGLGLVGLDCLPPLKRRFSAHAAGLAGHQSRLARGVPL